MSRIDKEIHLRLLRQLAEIPQVSQPELAEHLGVSLGKGNYCLRAPIARGLITVRNFNNGANRRACLYLSNPKGAKAKAEISVRFLQEKLDEHEALAAEIEELQNELKSDDPKITKQNVCGRSAQYLNTRAGSRRG